MVIGVPAAEATRAVIHVETCDWDRLARLMTLFRIDVLVIDALPETTKAQELAAQFPGRVYLAWYAAQPVKDREPIRRDPEKRVVHLDRTATLDLSAARLRGQQDFFCAMPAKLRARFIDEMCAPQRTVEVDDYGQPHAKWIETGPDHFRHAHNYMTVAAGIRERRIPDFRPVALDLTGRTVEGRDATTAEQVTHVVRPGYIPMPEGVVGSAGKLIDWRDLV
ncbi:MAG: hypothetical protein AB7Y46_08090 [Armatimonadota bacterium]